MNSPKDQPAPPGLSNVEAVGQPPRDGRQLISTNAGEREPAWSLKTPTSNAPEPMSLSDKEYWRQVADRAWD
jgi:hypothetical protein